MHDTAMIAGSLFAKIYGKKGMKVLDVGGQDINGSLKTQFQKLEIDYTCMDIEKLSGVDVVIKPLEKFPFTDETFDLIVSTSCFEHDPCFWITFREMCRVIKKGGFIYVNAPSNGPYHGYPGDNWRFYLDAGQALAFWASNTIDNKCYPVKVKETFHISPIKDVWIDFVAIWERVDEKQTNIYLSPEIKNNYGPLKKALSEYSF